MSLARTRGRRRLACYHEAGHCLARWFFGYHTHGAWVLTVDQVLRREWPTDDRGRICEAEGMVERYDIVSPVMSLASIDEMEANGLGADTIRMMRHQMPKAAEVAMIESIIGPVAEARFRKCSLIIALWSGGEGDLEDAKAIADAWFPEDQRFAARVLAGKRASALVRSSKGWAAISAVGEVLFERGRLDGAEIKAICGKAYGRPMMPYGRWQDHWPPSLDAIRSGDYPPVSGIEFIPENGGGAGVRMRKPGA